MKRNTRLALAGLMAAALGGMAGGAAAQSNANCDRACLKGLADKVLDSMPARAPHKLPLAPEYAATENSIPTVPHRPSPASRTGSTSSTRCRSSCS